MSITEENCYWHLVAMLTHLIHAGYRCARVNRADEFSQA
jgi:hypothetical protein